MAKTQLNNPEAYRFTLIKMIPIITEQLNRNEIKWNMPTTKDKKSEFSDIKINIVLGGRLECSPTIAFDSTYIGISLHKMMCSQNILTIVDGVIYVISIDKLRSIWGDRKWAYVQGRTYKDGLGMSSEMTRFKIEYIIQNADYSITLDEDLADSYKKEYDIVYG